MIRAFVICACFALVLAGCAEHPDARGRAARLAASAGLHRIDLQTDPFTLVAYARFGTAPALRVYIEGDGHSWMNRETPSEDPTPWTPVSLELASVDQAPSVAYLGRPCQYIPPGSNAACRTFFWTDGRYAESVIASTNAAIDRLKATSGAGSVELVGFSGGAVVAALVAARRHDVASLRTVAGNLDTAVWTERQKLSPLTGSLNPADFAGMLGDVPQLHFSGAEDKVVEIDVLHAFEARLPRLDCVAQEVVPGVGHASGWPAIWPSLLRQPVRCNRH